MKILIDDEMCIGCETCSDSCPEIFEVEEMARVKFIDDIPEELEDLCFDIMKSCPTGSIRLEA